MENKSLVERFMTIHEKPSTRFNKNLSRVYEMLDKYGTKYEDVDKVFSRATLKERLEIIKLLKEGSRFPKPTNQANGKVYKNIGKDPNKKYIDEAVSSTYRATYDKLAKKFINAMQEANIVWTTLVCDYGQDLGYYTEAVNKKLKAIAKKNILAGGVINDGFEAFYTTGISKIDNAFDEYLEQEADTFDESLGDACYCENFICYADGSYEYFNLCEDTFTDDTNQIECIIGIDYASGAGISWIRGEDDIEDLNNLLNI